LGCPSHLDLLGDLLNALFSCFLLRTFAIMALRLEGGDEDEGQKCGA